MSKESRDTALLPVGLHDALLTDAENQACVVEKLRACFSMNGYGFIIPPLVEFEESLLSGPGKAQARAMFRVMDPMTQRMMGVRTDMTCQIARIARTRLANAPRPLRLSYAGDVLRIQGTQLRPERQFTQAGVELIGSDEGEAYVEIIQLAANTISSLGVQDLSIDLTIPQLVPLICEGLSLNHDEAAEVREALNAKDFAALDALKGDIHDIAMGLLNASGGADKALPSLLALNLPEKAAALVDDLAKLVSSLDDLLPAGAITIDPGEYQGFEYQTGIGFTFFARGVRGELGRGGRYMVNADVEGNSEPATGFSLYLDSLMRALPQAEDAKSVYVPFGTDPSEINKLQDDGYQTVRGLNFDQDVPVEARRMQCAYLWIDGKLTKLD